jgi:hypothetical protein
VIRDEVSRGRVSRAIGARLATLPLRFALLSVLGCNQTFEFDVPPLDAATLVTASNSAPEPQADAESGRPYAVCAQDTDCPLSELHCEAQSGECFACVLDTHCPEATPRCDRLQRCVECLGDDDCAAEFTCDVVSRQCQQRCDSRDDCGPEAHDCDTERGACVHCDNDRECQDTPRPYCATGGAGCVACRRAADCAGGYCDEVTGSCVECRDTRDCGDDRVCNPSTYACQPL